MKARVISLVALIAACTPEPKSSSETTGGASSTEDESSSTEQTTTAEDSTQQSSSGETSSQKDSVPPALQVHALTPEIWSGRRLRRVYQAGEDGSIGTRLELFWDTELKAHCELDRIGRRLGGGDLEPGEKLHCFPFMGGKERCSARFQDPQCTQEVLVADADVDEVYQDLYEVYEQLGSDEPCDDVPAGLYKVKKFNKHALEQVFYRDETGACVARSYDEPISTVELGSQVPMEILASGTIVIE